MKRYDGFEAKRNTVREILPAGGYVVKIMGAEEQVYGWGSLVRISFDIMEGPKAGFFAKDYQANTREDRKWRGVYRLYEPKSDGSEKDQWTKNMFNNAVAVLQESNPGYQWDWGPVKSGDFSQLKGKIAGVLFREKQWEMDGRTGWTTECCALTSAEDIRQGNYQIPSPKPLPEQQEAKNAGKRNEDDFEELLDADGDLPF